MIDRQADICMLPSWALSGTAMMTMMIYSSLMTAGLIEFVFLMKAQLVSILDLLL